MNQKRGYAASLIHGNSIWILGGDDYGVRNPEMTSEFIFAQGFSVTGPNLPKPLSFHAVALINDTVSIVIGGRTSETFYSDQIWSYETKSLIKN